MKQSRKRNYVRKRRYLQNSINQIKEAIDFLHSAKGEPVDEDHSLRQATIFAQRIEAVCWSSHSPITPDGYQQSMETKTNELIFTLLQKEVPNMDSTKIQKIMALLNIYRSQVNKKTDAKAERTKKSSKLSSQKKYSSAHSESTPNASVLTFLTHNLCADSAFQKTNQISTQSPSFDASNPNSSPVVMKPASSLPIPLLNQLTVEKLSQKDQIKPPENDFRSQLIHSNIYINIDPNIPRDISCLDTFLNNQTPDQRSLLLRDFTSEDYLNIGKPFDSFNPLF